MTRRWDDAGGIVTPEAVLLQMPEANVGSRAVAWFIDAVALGLLLVVVNVLILMLGDEAPVPEWVGITVLLVVNFLLYFGYPVAFETLLGGRTPGKAALGLRVVTVEGAPVRFRHAAIRAALGLVELLPPLLGAPAVISALLSKRHQRLGDMVAGTVVLRERAPGAPAAVRFEVPPGAEGYATTIDPTGLSPRDYEAVREFLLRAPTLLAHARTDIGARLADGIGSKVQHRRPANVTPELFLLCTAARYQQRAGQLSSPATQQWAPPPSTPAPPAPPASDSPAAEPEDFAPPR